MNFGAFALGLNKFLDAATEISKVAALILTHKYKGEDELEAARKDLLNEFKDAYTRRDVGMAVDALRRVRQSK